MSTLQILLFVAIGVSLVATFIMKMPAANRKRARKQLAQTPWLDDDSKAGSPVKVTGIVRMREHGERFMSPISENRCVVLRLRVLVRHGQDPRAKLVEKLEIMPFVLEDQSGKLLIDSKHVVLDIAPVKPARHTLPRKTALLAELGYEDANGNASEVEETIVEVNTTVTIAGTLAQQQDADLPIQIVGDEQHPIAIRAERVSAALDP